MEGFTADGLWQALMVVLAVMAAFVGVMKFAEAVKSARKPADNLRAQVELHGQYLQNDKRRMEQIENNMESQRKGQQVMLRGVRALLEHEIHNGNEDELKDASGAIDHWLEEK